MNMSKTLPTAAIQLVASILVIWPARSWRSSSTPAIPVMALTGALEYLVIGRSPLDGYPWYHFVCSRSFGFYYIIAMSSAPDQRRGACRGIRAHRLVVRRYASCHLHHHFPSGLARSCTLRAALLVGLCAAFMEMNYLEPEGLVYLCGLLAFARAARAIRTQSITLWFLSGLLIGSSWLLVQGGIRLLRDWNWALPLVDYSAKPRPAGASAANFAGRLRRDFRNAWPRRPATSP